MSTCSKGKKTCPACGKDVWLDSKNRFRGHNLPDQNNSELEPNVQCPASLRTEAGYKLWLSGSKQNKDRQGAEKKKIDKMVLPEIKKRW